MNNENENKIIDLPKNRYYPDGLIRRRITASKNYTRERIRDLRNYSMELNERLRIEKNKN